MPGKRGHPPADLSTKLPIFEEAVAGGKKVGKALEIAEIPERTYYNHCMRNPEYRQKIVLLKRKIAEVSEEVLIEELERHPETIEERRERIALAERMLKRGDDVKPSGAVTNVTVNTGTQVKLDMKDCTDDQLRRIQLGTATAEEIQQEIDKKSPDKQ